MVSVGALASTLYAWVAEALLLLALLTLACTFAAPSGKAAGIRRRKPLRSSFHWRRRLR